MAQAFEKTLENIAGELTSLIGSKIIGVREIKYCLPCRGHHHYSFYQKGSFFWPEKKKLCAVSFDYDSPYAVCIVAEPAHGIESTIDRNLNTYAKNTRREFSVFFKQGPLFSVRHFPLFNEL